MDSTLTLRTNKKYSNTYWRSDEQEILSGVATRISIGPNVKTDTESGFRKVFN
jgi:hypothetical protein